MLPHKPHPSPSQNPKIQNHGSTIQPHVQRAQLSHDQCAPDSGPHSGPLVINTSNPSAQAGRGLQPASFTEIARETPLDTPTSRKYRLQEHHALLLPSSRLSFCGKRRIPYSSARVNRSAASEQCYLTGVMRCGSIWICPVCAARIAKQRRDELSLAMRQIKTMGLHVALVTATIPHGMGDELKVLFKQMSSAWSGMHAGRNRTVLGADIGRVGTIRSLEITYGANGFHPHFHALVIHDGSTSLQEIERRYKARWEIQCERAGLGKPSKIHGITVQDGSTASDYVAKWGIESEMTHSHSKTGKAGSLTPWDLSRISMEGGEDAERYATVFQIYAKATKGRRQLHWSAGLRNKLGLNEEKSDEEIAQMEETHDDEVVYTLSTLELTAISHASLMPLVLHVATVQPDLLSGLIAGIVGDYEDQRDRYLTYPPQKPPKSRGGAKNGNHR